MRVANTDVLFDRSGAGELEGVLDGDVADAPSPGFCFNISLNDLPDAGDVAAANGLPLPLNALNALPDVPLGVVVAAGAALPKKPLGDPPVLPKKDFPLPSAEGAPNVGVEAPALGVIVAAPNEVWPKMDGVCGVDSPGLFAVKNGLDALGVALPNVPKPFAAPKALVDVVKLPKAPPVGVAGVTGGAALAGGVDAGVAGSTTGFSGELEGVVEVAGAAGFSGDASGVAHIDFASFDAACWAPPPNAPEPTANAAKPPVAAVMGGGGG